MEGGSYDGRVLTARVRWPFALAAASTAVGLYFATQAMSNPVLKNEVDWAWALSVNLIYYWSWGLGFPLVVWLTRRFPLEQQFFARRLLLHAVFSAVVTVLLIIVSEAGLIPFRSSPYPVALEFGLRANFHSYLPTYWVILAGVTAYDYWIKYRDRELAATRLQARLSEARLDALRMQLDPHFLFNTLNSISSLMYSDVDRADEMISRLGDFLRLTLDADDRAMTTLDREVEFARRYLEIERVRFEERLHVVWKVDPETLALPVPSFLLQPLIENAVHHGISSEPAGGTITIATARRDGMLRVEVTNDRTAGDDAMTREGIGLRNTRERLNEIWGNRCSVDVVLEPRRARVSIDIPMTRETA